MNWDAIGSVGEIIGALAVVVSVIYLALQVKKQTDESRLAASRELASEYGSAIAGVTADLEFSAVWLKACQDYNSLPNKERLWASFTFQRMCRVHEQQYLHVSNKNVDAVYFESLQVALREWMTFPGAQQWWELSKGMFGSSFQTYVDNLMAEAKKRGYDSSFKRETDSAT